MRRLRRCGFDQRNAIESLLQNMDKTVVANLTWDDLDA
jgi:hypothetical protein